MKMLHHGWQKSHFRSHLLNKGALEAEMKSEFLSMFGIPPTECEIEVRKDDLGVPRLWFRSTGNLPVGLDLTGATQLQHLLTDAGEAKQANEIGQLITKAQHLSVNGL